MPPLNRPRGDPPAHALPPGLYESLLTQGIADAVDALGPRGRTGVLDPEDAPSVLAEHVGPC
jgi:hypothetical protein